MKLIEAVINKLKLSEVRNALDDMGVANYLESTVTCHSGEKGEVMVFRGARFVAKVADKVKLEIVAADDTVDKIIEGIVSVVNHKSREDCRIGIRPYLEVT
jgi:nitrogen regulatory protein PII